MFTTPAEDIQSTKRLKTPPEEVEKYFPGFLAFIDSTEQQQIPRPEDNRRCKVYYSGKKKRITAVKTQLMVNNQGIILHKLRYKKERKHDYDIYKRNHSITPKDVLNVFDLGYLGVEKDFSEQQYHPYQIERKETNVYNKKKSNSTLFIQKRG
jgi:hypothetical protein